jgi:hypothetical protein
MRQDREDSVVPGGMLRDDFAGQMTRQKTDHGGLSSFGTKRPGVQISPPRPQNRRSRAMR